MREKKELEVKERIMRDSLNGITEHMDHLFAHKVRPQSAVPPCTRILAAGPSPRGVRTCIPHQESTLPGFGWGQGWQPGLHMWIMQVFDASA